MVTLKDIARECQVSFSTVSKALKHSKEISEDTIKIIEEKAREMGYHPNVAARTLRTNRTYDLGVIFEDKTGSGLQHQYFAKILGGFQRMAQEKGYELTFISRPENAGYDYYTHIRSRNFDGVAILTAHFQGEEIQKLVFSDVPTVTLDYKFDDEHLCVMNDNQKGMRDLVEYVISKGHTKIAMIYGDDTYVTWERRRIFTETLASHGITCPENYFVESLYHDPEKSGKATEKLLSLQEPPTCIFYPDDYSALGGVQVLNSQKLIAGKDISIVGYDGIMLTSMMIPPLTTYEQDGVKIGGLMAQKLINLVEGRSDGSLQNCEVITGRLLEGGTVSVI